MPPHVEGLSHATNVYFNYVTRVLYTFYGDEMNVGRALNLVIQTLKRKRIYRDYVLELVERSKGSTVAL